jgi:GrpB-like predicted nucleotidyltransferase (UPF0157 family)
MNLKDKYVFRPYSSIFPELFKREERRLRSVLGEGIRIEHIGSTSVPGLGGKVVIDILVLSPKGSWEKIKGKLKALGYLYRPKDRERESEKLFFMADLADSELGTRLYHVHLSFDGSSELKNSIGFRDYLRAHPKELKEYAAIKKKAALEAQKFSSKDEMRDIYGKVKEEFIEKVLSKL